MKPFVRALLAVAVLAAGQGVLCADFGYSFSFTVVQKHGNGTKTENDFETVKNQKWSYLVTMENKSFKDVYNIEVKYVMFTKQEGHDIDGPTGQNKLERHTGTVPIKLIKNNDKVSFSTDSILLTNVVYNYGLYADETAKGALKGLWLRIYIGGQMVAEYMNPQDLSNKEQFDAPPPDNKKGKGDDAGN